MAQTTAQKVGDELYSFGSMVNYADSTPLVLDSSWAGGMSSMITFIEIVGAVDAGNVSWNWLKALESAAIDASVSRLVVFYNFNNEAKDPSDGVSVVPSQSWVSSIASGYGIAQRSAWCLFQGTFASSAIDLALPQFSFNAGGIRNPPTFLLDAAGTIVDRWSISSANNAHGDSGISSDASSLFAVEDLVSLSWPGTTAANIAMSLDYLRARARDIASPSGAPATLGWDGANPAPIAGGYNLNVTFAGRKVVRGWDAGAYDLRNSIGASFVVGSVSPAGKIDAAGTKGYLGSSPSTATAGEFRTLATGALADDSYTLALSTAAGHLIKDTTGAIAACSPALSFVVDTPTLEVKLTEVEGFSRETILDAGGDRVVVFKGPGIATTLAIAFATANPAATGPSATLDGSTIGFGGLVATIDAGALAAGPHTIAVAGYTNRLGKSCAGGTFNIGIVDLAAMAATARSDILEGWGYYPREEGLPSNCPENGADPDGDGTSVPAWSAVAAATPAPGAGNPLSLAAVAASSRSYGAIYNNASGTGKPWNAGGYVESMMSFSGAPGTSAKYFDADNPSVALGLSGVGMRFRDGPYVCELQLLTIVSTGDRRIGVRAHHRDSAIRAFKLAAGLVEWDPSAAAYAPAVIKVKKSGSTYSVSVDGTAASLTFDEKILPRIRYDEVGKSEIAFGILENYSQTIAKAAFEYLRYAFYDEKYAIGAGATPNALAIGFQNVFRDLADSANLSYRSSDISVDGHSADEPVFASDSPSVPVVATVTKTASGALAAKAVPVKVRFCVADFNDAAAESILGFAPARFPKIGDIDPGADSDAIAGLMIKPMVASLSTKVLALTAVATPTATSSLTWAFSIDRSKLRRRIVIIAYADAPLLDPPRLIAGKGATGPGGYFDTSMAGSLRVDPRCGVRQFLPDFYVRDTEADRGESPGGWLSPDLAMAVYSWDGVTALPNPQTVAESTYPWGFAVGQPSPYNYTPDGYIEVDSPHATDPNKKIRLTDSGWSDYSATVQYYNRMWVRVSNRGIVPGPASLQVFFLGSSLRAHFNPYDDANERNDEYEKIFAINDGATYVQDRFQAYPSAKGFPSITRAIPALSGASNPAASKNFTIAEFLWHVSSTGRPSSSDDSHGCRAACVNLSDDGSHPSFTSGIDNSGAIKTPSDDSVWMATTMTNNVSVRNSNIVQGAAASSEIVTTKMLIKDDSPVNFARMPNDLRMKFSEDREGWGLAVDASKFKAGFIALRLDRDVAKEVKLVGFSEISADAGGPAARSGYRFFALEGGKLGSLEGLLSQEDERGDGKAVRVFYHIRPDAKPDMYEIVLSQTQRGKSVGGYRIAIALPAREAIRAVVDGRTKFVYDLKKNPDALAAIPYERLAVFTGIGLAVQEGARFNPADEANFATGKLMNELANLPTGFKFPRRPKEIAVREDSLVGAIVGRVVDGRGLGIEGVKVDLVAHDRRLDSGLTDESGRYLILVKSGTRTVKPGGLLSRTSVRLSVETSNKGKNEVHAMKVAASSLCFAAKTIVIK
jgi:hypothetical protein